MRPMTTNRDPFDLFTRQEAADRLRVHIQTMNKLVKAGKLAAIKIEGRTLITRGALEAYIRGDTVDPLAGTDTGLPGASTPSMFNPST